MERKLSISSSSSSPPAKKYDVFLSFRGEDTRNNFMSHLSLALRKIGLFNIFKDDYALDKGKDIGPELMKAIEDSQCAVVVLSENYATSSWCLKEVTKIVECMGDSGRIRTIFYHVNPSHVRNVISSDEKKQKESSFWKALKEHAKNPTHSESLESWRNALVKVANQSGYPVEDHTDEAIFIEEFVAKISSELGASIKTIEGLFGMTSRLKELDSYVQSSCANNVSFVGIYGMGGIGKSTLAKAYYKLMSHKFDGSSFLENIREGCEKKTNGLVDFQRQLLSDILKGSFKEIRHVDNGIDMIRSRLCRIKVLIVLDDVNKLEQLNALAKEDAWFGSGSIIIVTTREDSFLKIKRYKIFRTRYLNTSEALHLFSSRAFGCIEPPKEFQKLSEEVVEYAGCLPLALTVLGPLLGSKKTSEWESALRRLRKYPENQIVETLKIGFDDLSPTDQQIFLDIACFFNGYEKDSVIQILNSCGFESEYGMSNLIDKSLLNIVHGSIVWMHDLLQEMGKEIVRKESGNQLGKQSRIWDVVDLYHVLENEEGTNKVEAIVTVTDDDQTMQLSFEGLSHMKKLRLLMISGFLPQRDGPELKYLSNDLKFLQWNGFCYNEFPSSFNPRKLVQLMAWNSNIQHLWNNCIKRLDMLKVIDLSYSEHFSKFDDFTTVPNLERLILEGCTNLLEIHPSIGSLAKLILLNLNGCTSLDRLPNEINSLASLQFLDLYGCSKLCQLPDNMEQLKSLRNLNLRDTSIEHMPSSIFFMKNLESLSCSNERSMTRSAIRENIMDHKFDNFLPSNLCFILTTLDLHGCNLTCEKFPEYFGNFIHLHRLDLSKNPFSVIPTGIKGLSNLKSLKLEYCERLQCLEPELLPSNLEEINVNYCTSLTSFLDPLKHCHLRCSSIFCTDCTELVKWQDGTMTAVASLSRFLQSLSNRRRKFEIVIPLHPQCDLELPAWFINNSSTASVSIKLDPNRRNKELIGLAMFFCLFPSPPGDYSISKIRVTLRGRKGKTLTTIEEVYTISIQMTQSLDHLVLHYNDVPESCREQLKSRNCDNLAFSFCDSRGPLAGPCGVSLIYENDIDLLEEITSTYNNESPNQKILDHVHSSKSVFKGEGVSQDVLIPTSQEVSPKELGRTSESMNRDVSPKELGCTSESLNRDVSPKSGQNSIFFSPASPVCYPWLRLKLKLKTVAAVIILLVALKLQLHTAAAAIILSFILVHALPKALG